MLWALCSLFKPCIFLLTGHHLRHILSTGDLILWLKSRRTHSADVADCKTCHMWQVVWQTLPKPKANTGFSLSQWRTKHCMLGRWPTNVPDAGSVCGCQWWDCARHKLVGCFSLKIVGVSWVGRKQINPWCQPDTSKNKDSSGTKSQVWAGPTGHQPLRRQIRLWIRFAMSYRRLTSSCLLAHITVRNVNN